MNRMEIKRCPFCGGQASVYTRYMELETKRNPMFSYVACGFCFAKSMDFSYRDIEFTGINPIEEAIKAWNRRDGELTELPSAQQFATDINVGGTDYISRADAVALTEDIENKRLKGEIDLTYAPMIKGIKALPSAQPECDNAVSREKVAVHIARTNAVQKMSMTDWNEILDAIESVPLVTPKQRWIPCSERMPDENFGCLVTIYRNNYFSGEHNEVFYELVGWDGETWNDCFGVPMDDEVVAWMPSPEPWEGGQE